MYLVVASECARARSRVCSLTLLAATAVLALGACQRTPAPSPSASSSTASARQEIAFHSDPGGADDFYAIDSDGTGLRQLTNHAETVAFPYWSPDGSRIAYLCCSGFDASLWVMNADGTDQRQLTKTRAGNPSWTPDGTHLLYDDLDDGGLWTIGVDADAAPTRLATQSAGGRISPDARSIVFFSWRDFPGQDQHNELYLMTVDGSGQRRLTTNEAEDVEPEWSPDGRRIVFTSTRDGNSEIYVANADGTDQRRLTNDPAPDEGPHWSPDGTRILFSSYRGGADPHDLGQGDAEIVTIGADGTGRLDVTKNPQWNGYPAWSPDGTRIAYSVNDGEDFDLFVIDADATNRRQLTGLPGEGIANDCCPAWRPSSPRS